MLKLLELLKMLELLKLLKMLELLKLTILNSYFSKSLTITAFRIIFLCSLIGLPHLPKGSAPIRAFCVIRSFMLFMVKVL